MATNPAVNPDDPLEGLLAAVARGDRSAFAELYAATSAQLLALLLRMLQRRDWAEEALQDCYVRIWQKSDGYSPERGAPMAWLATIDRKSTRLNSSHSSISYAVFCLTQTTTKS